MFMDGDVTVKFIGIVILIICSLIFASSAIDSIANQQNTFYAFDSMKSILTDYSCNNAGSNNNIVEINSAKHYIAYNEQACPLSDISNSGDVTVTHIGRYLFRIKQSFDKGTTILLPNNAQWVKILFDNKGVQIEDSNSKSFYKLL